MRLFVLLCAFYSVLTLATAQTANGPVIYGIVTNEKEELLAGATVFWKDGFAKTITNAQGQFWIAAPPNNATLAVQYIGYTPAEVSVAPGEDSLWIEVKGITQLAEVKVTAHRFDNVVSTISTRNVESINGKELRKAPCCNLSESFQTNGAVDVTYPNAVTGVKEIQMLGLRGIYSQFLIENRPTMTGIALPFAFEYIPGTWLNGIALAKGASSVKNGFNGITGQVSVDLMRPATDKPIFINAFTSTEGRGELNVHLNRKGKGHWAQGVLAHGSLVRNKWDMNRDNFYDTPNRHQINGLYRIFYDGPAGKCGQINVQALTDRRQSGQIAALPGEPRFGIDQRNDRVEVWGKFGQEGVGGKPYQEWGNIASGSWHRTRSIFGNNVYDATQQSLYLQSLWGTIIDNTNHKIVVAPSLTHEVIQEAVNNVRLDRTETVPGIMAEYTYSRPNADMEMPDLVVVVGSRVDWNSRFGWFFVPRFSLKYNFNVETVLRLSGGRGYRSPNLIAENISLLARNYDTENSVLQESGTRPAGLGRALYFAQDLSYEEAWNYGANLTRNFHLFSRKGNINVDLYRTQFVRQIVVDVDRSPTSVSFYNAPGPSYSNSAVATVQYNLVKGLDLKLAAKWQDVRTTFADGVLRTPPLVPRYRGLVSLDYETPNKKWSFNAHTQIVGTQRLPDNSQVPHNFTHGFPATTPTFALLNAQATHHFNSKWEIYLGGENLTRYRQHAAILSADQPWGSYFNGAQVWAPMMGPIVYMGVRIAPK